MSEYNAKLRQDYLRKEARRASIRRLGIILAIVFVCAGCSGLTYLIGTGAWGALVTLINAIIEGGPAVIVATLVSIVGANFLLTICLPIVIFVLIVFGIAYWQTR